MQPASSAVAPGIATLLEQLREHTAREHRAVEAVLDLATLADRGRYARVLGRLYGFHAPFERMLARAPAPATLAIDKRRKLPWLRADLAAFGWSHEAIAALPECTALAPPRDVGAIVGGMYVIEGATLGGQVIRRELARMHAAAPVPMAYFTSYGEGVGRSWRDFRIAAEALVTGASGRDAACAYAAATFTAFGTWLAGVA